MSFNNIKIDSASGDSSEDSEEKNKKQQYEEYEDLLSQFVMSNEKVSAVVGTSQKSSISVRNKNQPESKIAFSIKSEEIKTSDDARLREMKKEPKKSVFNNEFAGASLISNKSPNNASQDLTLYDDILSDDLGENFLEHMTIIAEDPDQNTNDETKNFSNNMSKLKISVITVLLTQKLKQEQKALTDRAKRKKKKKQIRYLPTYRMDPKINLLKDDNTRNMLIIRLKQTFHSLVDKHGRYDKEYTPRFLKIVTEMIKNDVKMFKLERFKIVVLTSIFQKINNHSVMFISKELKDIDYDYMIKLVEEVNTFHAICLIYLVYVE